MMTVVIFLNFDQIIFNEKLKLKSYYKKRSLLSQPKIRDFYPYILIVY